MTVVSIVCGGLMAQGGVPSPRRNNEGQANMGAHYSVASDPWSVYVWWMFSECGVLFVLHFSIICSAAEIPREQN